MIYSAMSYLSINGKKLMYKNMIDIKAQCIAVLAHRSVDLAVAKGNYLPENIIKSYRILVRMIYNVNENLFSVNKIKKKSNIQCEIACDMSLCWSESQISSGVTE